MGQTQTIPHNVLTQVMDTTVSVRQENEDGASLTVDRGPHGEVILPDAGDWYVVPGDVPVRRAADELTEDTLRLHREEQERRANQG